MAGPNYGHKQLGAGNGFDWINAGGQALKYIVPAARMLGNERALRTLRKQSKLKFDPVSLYHGAVRDMPTPNAVPRYRPAAGSSLAEYISGQKYTDAAQRSEQNQYQYNNALSKLDQEGRIRESRNQEILGNATQKAQVRGFNAANAQNEKMYRMQQQEELQLGMTETAMNDLTNKNYVDAAEKSSAAANILRYGDPNSPQYKKAMEYYTGQIMEFNAGGKVKRTKFSK